MQKSGRNKQKKKNVETGLLMGQNTNVFSQLSASYLQNKSSNTEQEERFLKSTPVVEYHDHNINRLIALLRKKADVTKIKAVSELREEIQKMSPDQVEEFISTFAQLYMEVVMNESSKQIIEEFATISVDLLARHKKAVIGEINTLYPPLLISHRLPKLAPLLFTGTEEELGKKSLVLLLKKDVSKKFVVMVRLIMDCEASEKIAHPHMQRNCQALARVLRDFIRIFQKNEKTQELQPEFSRLITQVCDSFGKECVQQFFKVGGRAKASILQLYSTLLSVASRRPQWKLRWEAYAKIIGECFLQKDPMVQMSLWKGALHLWLEALLLIESKQGKQQQRGRILDSYLPKIEEKVLASLALGGFAMYKQLPRFCEIFPETSFNSWDSHKQLVNKLTFCRKLLGGVMAQEDENEARMQCYTTLVSLLLGRARGIVMPGDEKKAKEIQSLVSKFQKEVFESLQDRFYNEPPASKNSFSYYMPQYFVDLVNSLQPSFQFKFDPELTFSLYQGLTPTPSSSQIIDAIFERSLQSQTLTLKYLESFPKRTVDLDMTEANREVQSAAKIFLLTSNIPQQGEEWISPEWDVKKQLIAFDPRITLRDLEAEDEAEEQQLYSLYFRPTHKAIVAPYDNPQLDYFRFKYFQDCLLDEQSSHYARYLLPFVTDVLLPRNPSFTNQLFTLFADKSRQAEAGKWTVGAHEVLIVRVLSQLLFEAIIRERGFQKFHKETAQACLESFCEFVRLLSAYKMDNESEDLLRRAQGLLAIEEARPAIFKSCQKALEKAWKLLLEGKLEGPEKIRKNRIKKCIQLTSRLLIFSLPETKAQQTLQLATEFIQEENNWREGADRSQPWHIAHTILGNVYGEGLTTIVDFLLSNYNQNSLQITQMLSVDYLLPLQALPEIRKRFVYVKTLLQKKISQIDSQALELLLTSLVSRNMKEGVLALSEGLRGLIAYLLLQKQDDNLALLEVLKKAVVVGPYEQFIRPGKDIHHTLIYNTIVSAVPLKRIEEAGPICAELTSQLLKAEGSNFMVLLSTTCLLWNKGVGSAEAIDNDAALLKKIIVLTLKAHSSPSSPLAQNFAAYSFFTLVNVAVSLGGWGVAEQFEKDIETLFWKQPEHGSELEGLALSVKMRYASRAVLSAGEASLSKLIKDLPEIIGMQLDFFSQILRNLEGDEEDLPHHESIVSLFIQSAQFLLRAGAYVNESRMPSEKTLLSIVRCQFPALKKAAFLLLKSMYEAKVVARGLPVEFKGALQLQLKGEELSTEVCRDATGYLYAWQLLIMRREATERVPENEEELPVSLEDVIQADSLSELLIRNCFFILEDKLDYLKNELDYPVTPEELLEQDMQSDFLEDGEPEKRMFRLATRTLFLFITNFPLFLRDFMDRFKKYRNICERLLRNVMSEAIFRQEVARIEIMEPEWKASGSFEVYVIANNKEIYAEYVHDLIRIGLRLVMRSTYPLTPIVIEFGEGLKMEDGSRWGLMLQSQLHNRNSSVIRGIMLWKENIDKKLSGVEECSICFDIVNTHGQLPKKGCKTCRKKFHGNCIMKWFSKSNKSECPLCKSQFL